MNSFIFNFNKDARVVLGTILLLFICEGVVRFVEGSLSKDIRHIREIPTIVERLQNTQSSRVLFLGNSLTRAGVDLETLRQAIQAPAGKALTLESIYPDDTTICDWYYVYRTFLVNRRVNPDLVVVGYALDHLEDHAPLHMGRLGGYFGGWAALPEAFRYDIPEVGDRVQYALSSTSRLFADQERIRDRLLDFVVPNYRESAQALNSAALQSTRNRQERNQPTYQRLQRFIRLLQTNGTKLILVAMPLPSSYSIPDALTATVAAEGASLLDLRHVEGLAKEDFPDHYHLSPKGAQIYSSALSTRLRESGLF
jgi:hypothetical protein